MELKRYHVYKVLEGGGPMLQITERPYSFAESTTLISRQRFTSLSTFKMIEVIKKHKNDLPKN